jgi:hypothetical protein
MMARTALEKRLPASWSRGAIPASPAAQAAALRQGIAALGRAGKAGRSGGLAPLPEQPFDACLLAWSPLYRRSRRMYVEGGGEFRAALQSSPRTLGSPALLSQRIEYSPIESELVWAATDPRQRGGAGRRHLLELRGYSSSLFHEQNHRILWRYLPPAPSDPEHLRRYLNFAESLVIALDMALGDELGPRIALLFYLSGVTYDRGTDLRLGKISRRAYRNYLQAALHATYLNLELFDPDDIPRAIEALFPGLGPLAARAARRSGGLDRGFISRTNRVWQRNHRAEVRRVLGGNAGAALRLPGDPMYNREQYLFAERFFERFGL